MDPFWKHIVVAATILAVVSAFARLTDWWLQRRPLPPEAVTRYRVFRRSVTVAILVIGLFSALLAIPDVRAVAGGLLASSALLAVVIGFAAQRTLGNFVAGLLIALAQPVRIGDRVEYEGTEGVIEEVGLTYTFIRAVDRRRLVVPNEKLASDPIFNASIRSRETAARSRSAAAVSRTRSISNGSVMARSPSGRAPHAPRAPRFADRGAGRFASRSRARPDPA